MLAACSGGNAGHTLPPTPGAIAGNGGGSLQIVVPYAAGSGAGSKTPQFVSPGTKSVEVVATANTGCGTCTAAGQTVISNLSSASPSCVTGVNGFTCTLTFALAPGTYTLGVATYSVVLVAGQPSGALLSQNQAVPLAIVSGANSVANAVLDGVPASFDLVPSVGTLVKQTATYRSVTPNTAMTISIITRDATGAAIVGPGAPGDAATFVNSGNAWTNVAINGATITATSPGFGRTNPLTINATANAPTCVLAGAVCSASLTIEPDQVMAVASRSNNSVVIWSLGVPNSPLATVTLAVDQPNAAIFDAYGNLIVSNSGNNTVTVYTYPFASAPTQTLSTGISQPQALAADSAGTSLAISNFGSNSVTIYPYPYSGVPGVVSIGMHGPVPVAFDPVSGDLFIGQQLNNTVTGYPAPYANQAPTTTIAQGLQAPNVLFFMPNVAADLYVANSGSIERFSRPFNAATPVLTIASTAAAPVSKPYSLASVGGPARIIAADPFAHAVNIYPVGSNVATSSLNISQNPGCAVPDRDGILYVCNYAFAEIQSYLNPYTGASTATYFQGLAGTDSIALFP